MTTDTRARVMVVGVAVVVLLALFGLLFILGLGARPEPAPGPGVDPDRVNALLECGSSASPAPPRLCPAGQVLDPAFHVDEGDLAHNIPGH